MKLTRVYYLLFVDVNGNQVKTWAVAADKIAAKVREFYS